MDKILTIAAHEDDESFGCLGTLLKHSEEGAKIHFVWFTDSRQSTGEYPVVDFFKATYSHAHLKDQELDTYPLKQLISHVEEAVSTFKPTIVYMPFIGDLNKDHRLVSEAAMVACRPYKNLQIKEMWMYSIAGTTELGLRPIREDKVNVIERKVKHTLISSWYPNEMINGRGVVLQEEVFEKWPVKTAKNSENGLRDSKQTKEENQTSKTSKSS